MSTPLSEVPITVARTAGVTSASLTSMTWIANLNEILQLVATGVAIVSGLFAAWWYFERAIQERKNRLSTKDKED